MRGGRSPHTPLIKVRSCNPFHPWVRAAWVRVVCLARATYSRRQIAAPTFAFIPIRIHFSQDLPLCYMSRPPTPLAAAGIRVSEKLHMAAE